MNYRVIKSTKEPSVTSYYIKDSSDKDYKLVMWDSGMFRIFNEEGEQAKYTYEESKLMMDAIKHYKLKQTLTPNTAKTFGDIIDEL
jgi:hypothetical protein